MENFLKLIEAVQSLEKILVWRVLCPSFMLSLSSFLVLKNLSKCFILGAMLTAIEEALLGIAVISGVAIVYKIVASWIVKLFEPVMNRRKEREQKEKINTLLSSLRPAEISILKFIFNREGVAWLPAYNGHVMKLFVKGLLKTYHQVSSLRALRYTETDQCFLSFIPDEIFEYLKRYGLENNNWKSIEENSSLEIFQGE